MQVNNTDTVKIFHYCLLLKNDFKIYINNGPTDSIH